MSKRKPWLVIYWSDLLDKQIKEGFDTYEEAMRRKFALTKKGYTVIIDTR